MNTPMNFQEAEKANVQGAEMSIKARIITLLLLAVIVTALGACGGEDKPQGPPPECMTDSDCGPYKACRAAKCIVVQTPENMAGNALKLAKEELEKSDVNYKRVLELYDEARKHVPNIDDMDFNIAVIYVKMRRFDQAMPKIDMLLEKDPTNEELILAKGKVYMMMGEADKALEFFQKQAEANPDSLNVRNNIATIYRQRKDWDNALKYIRQIFMLDPAHAGAFNNLGLIYLAQDKVLLSRMVTANGIQAQKNTNRPEDAGLYNNLGLIYLKMGEKNRAVSNFRKAFKIDKTLTAANLNLGHICVAGRDWKTRSRALSACFGRRSREPGSDARFGPGFERLWRTEEVRKAVLEGAQGATRECFRSVQPRGFVLRSSV